MTYHAKSAQNSNLLPELSGGDAYYQRNSFCQIGYGARPNFFGVSDSLSSRVNMNQYGLNSAGGILAAVNNNSSNSNQTATPVQQQESKKKVDDLNDATKRVQILPPAAAAASSTTQQESSTNPALNATKTASNEVGGPDVVGSNTGGGGSGAGGYMPSKNLQMIYEKLNMIDRKKIAQFNNAVTMVPS